MSLSDLGASAAASGWRAKVTDAVARRLDASPETLGSASCLTLAAVSPLSSVSPVYEAGSVAGASSSAGILVNGSATAAPTR